MGWDDWGPGSWPSSHPLDIGGEGRHLMRRFQSRKLRSVNPRADHWEDWSWLQTFLVDFQQLCTSLPRDAQPPTLTISSFWGVRMSSLSGPAVKIKPWKAKPEWLTTFLFLSAKPIWNYRCSLLWHGYLMIGQFAKAEYARRHKRRSQWESSLSQEGSFGFCWVNWEWGVRFEFRFEAACFCLALGLLTPDGRSHSCQSLLESLLNPHVWDPASKLWSGAAGACCR